MLLGIQLLGVVFIAIMIYFTYLNYKRHNYGSRSFISWLFVWVASGVVVLFPSPLYGFMGALSIDRIQDFFYIAGFIVLFVVVFNMYVTIKKTHAKVERLVREDAMRNPLVNKKVSRK